MSKNLTIGPGKQTPKIVNCQVEIPQGQSNKYEYDHQQGIIKLDRVLYGAVFYPTEYGFIPQTLSRDGDPLDIMVIATYPTFPGCFLSARVIASLHISDNQKDDNKVIGVINNDPRLDHIQNLDSLGNHFRREIENFWQSYAKLQPDKKITVGDWADQSTTQKIITEAIKRFRKQ